MQDQLMQAAVRHFGALLAAGALLSFTCQQASGDPLEQMSPVQEVEKHGKDGDGWNKTVEGQNGKAMGWSRVNWIQVGDTTES